LQAEVSANAEKAASNQNASVASLESSPFLESHARTGLVKERELHLMP